MQSLLRPIATLVTFLDFALCPSLLTADDPAFVMPAATALAKLQEGNARFVSAANTAPNPTTARRADTGKAEHPFAIIVGCSDSRTPPEMIFDRNLGDMFVIRTGGEVTDKFEPGSIEYAVERLGPRLIVVCGHARCGAGRAALEGGDFSGHVGTIAREIHPAVESVRDQSGDQLVDAHGLNRRRAAQS